MLKKLIFALGILLLLVGAVSAADNITDEVAAVSDDSVLMVDENQDNIAVSDDQPVISDEYDYGISIEDDVVTKSSSANVRVILSGPASESGDNIPVDLKVYDGSKVVKSISKNVKVNEWSVFTLTGLVNGKYIIEVSANDGLHKHSAGLTVNMPSKLKVSAPAVKVTQGAGKYFKVTVKKGDIPVKNLKLKVKVWTGKKVKTYTVKTDKKGVAKLSTKKLKVGSHKVKVVSSNNKYKFTKVSKIKVSKKSNLKHFALKVKHSMWYPSKKNIGKDVVYTWFEDEVGRQSPPGVYVEANYKPDGRSSPKHIKLVKASFYFDTYDGPVKVKTVKAKSKGWIETKLVKDYTPFKVVVYYKKV